MLYSVFSRHLTCFTWHLISDTWYLTPTLDMLYLTPDRWHVISDTIISDNGTHFASKQVVSFRAKYKITHRFSTPYYPQGNGQADISNHTILDSLCQRQDKVKGKWVESLLEMPWAYRTNKHIPTGETPFSLAYGTEAIIPLDIYMPTLWTEESIGTRMLLGFA